jgi:hypothetical protein
LKKDFFSRITIITNCYLCSLAANRDNIVLIFAWSRRKKSATSLTRYPRSRTSKATASLL